MRVHVGGRRPMTAPAARPCTFSLLISTFNRAEQLSDALRTALDQDTDGGTFSYEVIVVDNNSSDSTRAVVESFLGEGHSNLRYLFEGRQGKSFALNTALASATGAFYTIVDDDFLLPPNWLRRIRDGIQRHPDAAFYGGKVLPRWAADPPAWLTQEHWSAIAMADYGDREFRATDHHRICLLACTFRTEEVRAVGGYDVRLGVQGNRIGGVEDLDILTRLWEAGREGVYLPDVAFEHRVEAHRLEKRYHRRWHRDHGRSFAVMRDPGTEGHGPRLFGIPRYMYRELLGSVGSLLRETIAGHPSRAFVAEIRIWFIVGFCLERWSQRLGVRRT
jgi:glycosyltransferase involved in cell wall biosynthesis